MNRYNQYKRNIGDEAARAYLQSSGSSQYLDSETTDPKLSMQLMDSAGVRIQATVWGMSAVNTFNAKLQINFCFQMFLL